MNNGRPTAAVEEAKHRTPLDANPEPGIAVEQLHEQLKRAELRASRQRIVVQRLLRAIEAIESGRLVDARHLYSLVNSDLLALERMAREDTGR